jgi:hypothetical protein
MKQHRLPPKARSANLRDRPETSRRDLHEMMTHIADNHYKRTVSSLPAGDQRLLRTLRLYYSYFGNGFLLVEALQLCVKNKCNPPTWVLEPLADAFAQWSARPITLERALSIGKRDRQEYDQFRQWQPIMAEVEKERNKDQRRHVAPACLTVATRHDNRPNAEVIEKQYRKGWAQFFAHIGR